MDEHSRALHCWHERVEERSEKSLEKRQRADRARATAIAVEVSVENVE